MKLQNTSTATQAPENTSHLSLFSSFPRILSHAQGFGPYLQNTQ